MIQAKIDQAVVTLRSLTELVFVLAEDLRDEVLGLARAGHLTVPGLSGLKPLIFAGGESGLGLHGMGYVAAPGVVTGADRFVEWWAYRPGGDHQKLVRELDPNRSGFYDYPRWDWYKRPESGVTRAVAGPFVDEPCTGEYAMTLTVPVLDGERFLGVAGADVLVASCQATAYPIMRTIGLPAFIANATGRIIVTTASRWVAGDVYRGEPGYRSQVVWPGLILYVQEEARS